MSLQINPQVSSFISPATAHSGQHRWPRWFTRMPRSLVQRGFGSGVSGVHRVPIDPREEPEETIQSRLIHFNFLLCLSLVYYLTQPHLVLSLGPLFTFFLNFLLFNFDFF